MVMLMFERLTFSARCPGKPVIELVRMPPVATTLLMETFRSAPGVGTACPRPRLPSRMKMGVSTSRIVILETTTPSSTAPSTISTAIPEMGPRETPGLPYIAQFVTEMLRTSPRVSVPILKALHLVVRMQFVTVMFSLGFTLPPR